MNEFLRNKYIYSFRTQRWTHFRTDEARLSIYLYEIIRTRWIIIKNIKIFATKSVQRTMFIVCRPIDSQRIICAITRSSFTLPLKSNRRVYAYKNLRVRTRPQRWPLISGINNLPDRIRDTSNFNYGYCVCVACIRAHMGRNILTSSAF